MCTFNQTVELKLSQRNIFVIPLFVVDASLVCRSWHVTGDG